jgi:hypothetical protein
VLASWEPAGFTVERLAEMRRIERRRLIDRV